jgi:hypothetical protein
MTEADWLACNDPEPMLQFLCGGQASERKMRLLACACCRRVWDLLTDPRSRRAVEVAERFADRQATPRELGEALRDAAKAADLTSWAAYWAANRKLSGPILNVFAAASALRRQDLQNGVADWDAALALKSRRQVRLVHEVMGNPFRPRALGPDWLAWESGVARHLAEGIYQEQAFERMGVLGDALEDAGCTDEVILGHCRGPGEHVRGCWVLDLILDKV